MQTGRSLLATALVLTLSACESGDISTSAHAAPRTTAQAPAPTVQVGIAQPAPVPAAVLPTPAETPKPAENAVEWKGDIQWHPWSEGLPLASKQSKPILVLVYADWCPHCRALGPVFADPEIESLSKNFVMIRQNNDEEPTPAWLQPYNQKYGGYVPRIFFFDSSGKMREELTSGHPQYPYFYAAEQPEFLKKTMRRAIGS